MWHAWERRGKESVQGFGDKARRKVTTHKTEAGMGECDQNEP
jgi:hypothetical protein